MLRSRLAILAIGVLVVVAGAFAAYLLLSQSTPPAHSTTSILSTPANLLAVTGQVPAAYCSQPNGTYSNSSLSINWGNLAPGTEGIQFLCIKNTGTTGITVAVSSDLSPTMGKVTSPQAGAVLNGNGVAMIELDLWLTPGVQTGPVPSFTITIGAKT